MKNISTAFCLCFFLLGLLTSGCDSNWEKSFVRKRVKPVKPAQFEVGNTAASRPYPELYKEHYRYWQGWQEELIQDLGRNHKADVQNIREARRQLESLKKYLRSEKAEQADKFLTRFDQVTAGLLARSLQPHEFGILQRQLESLELQISSQLHPKKVKGSLLPTPLPLDMKEYQGDEPVLTQAPSDIKPASGPADRSNDAGDDLSYEKFRALSLHQ